MFLPVAGTFCICEVQISHAVLPETTAQVIKFMFIAILLPGVNAESKLLLSTLSFKH